MKKIVGRLSYANVVATMALFVALGGVGYAATQLPKNSVGTKQLKNGAVTAKKLGKSAKGSLAGPTGPQGAQGPPGTAGEPGSARAYALVGGEGELIPGFSKNVTAVSPACPGPSPNECASPPTPEEAEEPFDFCFKLGFEPKSVSATAKMGRTYAPDAATHLEATIPGREYGDLRGGCPPGYRDAEVRSWKERGGSEVQEHAYYGFYVVFN